MNFLLAIKLKEAGFTQYGKGISIVLSENLAGHIGDVYFPTLEELIDRCGKIRDGLYLALVFTGGYWECGYGDTVGKTDPETLMSPHLVLTPHVHGMIPEDAMANLWLAINKK